MNKSEKFKIELINASESSDFEDVLKEWTFIETFYSENNCICGQHIYESCVIHNILNNNYLLVGNICVKNFMTGLYETNNISKLQRLNKKIRTNKLNFNNDLINLHGVNYLTREEYTVLEDFTNRAEIKGLVSNEMFEEVFELYKKIQKKAQPLISDEECEKSFNESWGHLTLIKQEELEEIEYKERQEILLLRKQQQQEELKKLEYINKCEFIINSKKLQNIGFNFRWIVKTKYDLGIGKSVKYESIDKIINGFKLNYLN